MQEVQVPLVAASAQLKEEEQREFAQEKEAQSAEEEHVAPNVLPDAIARRPRRHMHTTGTKAVTGDIVAPTGFAGQ